MNSLQPLGRSVFAAGVIAFFGIVAVSAAEPLPAIYDCLPEKTLAVVNLPNPNIIFSRLKDQTRIGSLLSEPERWEKLTKLLRDAAGDELDETINDLAKYRFKPDDWQQLIDGPSALAVFYDERDNGEANFLFIAALQPSADLGDRMFAALDQWLGEQAGSEAPIRRIDETVADQQVIHLVIPPQVSKDDKADKGEKPRPRDAEEDPRKLVDTHVFIARVGPRILMTINSLPGMESNVSNPDEVGEHESDLCREQMGRLLTQHREGPARACRLLDTPGIAAALPAGDTLVDVIVDPRPIVRWSLAEADSKPAGDDKALDAHRELREAQTKLFRAAALDSLGPVVLRQSIDGLIWRSGWFASVPAPRRGVFTALDQEPIASQPAEWVSADVLDYNHYSANLEELYRELKSTLIEALGERASGGFGAVELQLQGAVQTDVATLLGSLGQQHTAIALAAKGDAGAKADPFQAQSQLSRQAMVWKISNEGLWRKIIATVLTVGAGKGAEEQGFTGIRFDQGGVQGGAFVGNGYLVVGIGADVVEPVLANLRRTPEGESSLAGSSKYRHACELLPPQPGIFYRVSDVGQAISSSRKQMSQVLAMSQNLGVRGNDESSKWLKAYLDAALLLLPSDEESKGLYSLQVTQGRMTEQGFMLQSALELMPVEK